MNIPNTNDAWTIEMDHEIEEVIGPVQRIVYAWLMKYDRRPDMAKVWEGVAEEATKSLTDFIEAAVRKTGRTNPR